MKTLPMPPREFASCAQSDRVPNAAGITIAFAISLLFWGAIAFIIL